MYAEAGLLLPFFQGSPQEAWGFHHDLPLVSASEEHLVCASLPSAAALNLDNLVQLSTISEYDLGGEGDLFKAPEPILGELVLPVDPIMAAMSMMSGGGSIISAETIKDADMSPIENEDLLNEVLSECKKDLIAKSAIAEVSQEASDVTVAPIQAESDLGENKKVLVAEGPLQKSVSAGCLNLETELGIRRAYSEGDIKYACRKALADSQPRIRGRFARTDEPEELQAVTLQK